MSPLPEPLNPVPRDAPRPGSVWAHWKEGGRCAVIAVSRHSETGEFLVTYHKDNAYWSRPLAQWRDIQKGGMPRFKEVIQ